MARKYPKKLGLLERFPYGQYEGKLVQTIVREDPDYIRWWKKNVKIELVLDTPYGVPKERMLGEHVSWDGRKREYHPQYCAENKHWLAKKKKRS